MVPALLHEILWEEPGIHLVSSTLICISNQCLHAWSPVASKPPRNVPWWSGWVTSLSKDAGRLPWSTEHAHVTTLTEALHRAPPPHRLVSPRTELSWLGVQQQFTSHRMHAGVGTRRPIPGHTVHNRDYSVFSLHPPPPIHHILNNSMSNTAYILRATFSLWSKRNESKTVKKPREIQSGLEITVSLNEREHENEWFWSKREPCFILEDLEREGHIFLLTLYIKWTLETLFVCIK